MAARTPALILLVALALAGCTATGPQEDADPGSGSGPGAVPDSTPSADPPGDQATGDGPSDGTAGSGGTEADCEDEVAFTASPLAIEDLGAIVPLGQMSGQHITPTDHQYWIFADSESAPGTYTIYVPADGTVTSMEDRYFDGETFGGAGGDEDWRIVVRHGCHIEAIYIHLDGLSQALQAAWDDADGGRTRYVELAVAAGDPLGTSGGRSFDFSVHDERVTLPGLLSPELYDGEPWKVHTVDPFPLFSADIRTALEARVLGAADPLAGKIDHDIAGRLAGNWVLEEVGTFSGQAQDYWTSHLAVAYDHFDPSRVVVSVGDWGGQQKQFFVQGNAPDPATIGTDDGVVAYPVGPFYGYEDADGQHWDGLTYAPGIHLAPMAGAEPAGWALFQVLEGERLKAEFFPGVEAEPVFTDGASMYVR